MTKTTPARPMADSGDPVLTLEVGSGALFVCAMQPGLVEDGVQCELPMGRYELRISDPERGGARGFSLVAPGHEVDQVKPLGTLSIDMARVGVCDRDGLMATFEDPAALFEWSDADQTQQPTPWGGRLVHASELPAFYVDVGSDGQANVAQLCGNGHVVGFEVVPRVDAVVPPARCYTIVEIGCQGLDESWTFVDDWQFEPELDDILDDVVSEVAAADSDDPIAFGAADAIDPDQPIAGYRRRFQGLLGIKIYLERDALDPEPLDQAGEFVLPASGERVSCRELAGLLHTIFAQARGWVGPA